MFLLFTFEKLWVVLMKIAWELNTKMKLQIRMIYARQNAALISLFANIRCRSMTAIHVCIYLCMHRVQISTSNIICSYKVCDSNISNDARAMYSPCMSQLVAFPMMIIIIIDIIRKCKLKIHYVSGSIRRMHNCQHLSLYHKTTLCAAMVEFRLSLWILIYWSRFQVRLIC